MGMFGSVWPSSFGTPYAPTPEELARAKDRPDAQSGFGVGLTAPAAGEAATPPAAPTGMFGRGLAGAGASAMSAGNIAAGIGQPPSGGMPSVADTVLQQAPAATLGTIQPPHPGFFQHGGLGQTILGRLSEAALQYQASEGDPHAASVFQNRYAQQQFQQETQLRRMDAINQRAAEQSQWMAREQWKREHPEDDDFTRTVRAAGIDPASPEGQAMFRTRANTVAQGMNALPQMMPIPGVGTFAAPRGGATPGSAASSPAAPPDEAVARLRSNPHEAAKFDEIFGAGASARYLGGGAASTASTPFPIR